MKTADDRHFRVEREEREKEESFPPHPLYKEQKEQRREFSVSAASRENFRQECLKYVGMVNEERLTDFFYYWSETDRQGRIQWIAFRQKGDRLAVIDDERYRIFRYKDSVVGELEVENTMTSVTVPHVSSGMRA